MRSQERLDWISMLALTLPLAGLTLYFLYVAIWGNDGYLALLEQRAQIVNLERTLEEVRTESAELKDRTRRLSLNSIDLDLLDERARRELGFARPDERILVFPASRE